jgi:aminoglycoside phosphotransferase (APT) family kinase protein
MSENISADDPSVRLSTWLSAQEQTDITVTDLNAVSAGARRFNALLSATTASGTTRYALTMIPTASIQLLDVADEASVRQLAESAGVPVPHIHHVCTDESVLGGPFFISIAVEGETVPRRVLRLIEQHDNLGSLITRQIGTALADLHSIPESNAPRTLLPDSGLGPIAHALSQVDEGLSELLTPSPAFSFCARWLERNAPIEPAWSTIVHSDVRNGNIIVGQDGLRAILDWEGSRIGDRMEDLAWTTQRMWRFREDHLPIGGFGTINDLRTAYLERGGEWDDDRFHWWRVLLTVRWGLGMAGQSRSHLDGSFVSIVMSASARRMAELEFDALQLLR